MNHLKPPKNAIVISVDEKSQIQALERKQAILHFFRNIPDRQTHDYYRHGNTTLFAALRVASGQVIGKCYDRHRSVEFIDFLELLDKKLPKSKILHVILDNYIPHKSKETKAYLEKKKNRFVFHYTPTHSSWLNLVERFFAEITQKCIRHSSWKSKKSLEQAIMAYIKNWCKSKRKFVWTAEVETIQSKIDWLKEQYTKMNLAEH